MRKVRATLARTRQRLHSQIHLNTEIVNQMNAASLAFLDASHPDSKAAMAAQTDPDLLQLIIDRQRVVINGLAEDLDVSNRRRFAAEEMLYRSNLPKLKI